MFHMMIIEIKHIVYLLILKGSNMFQYFNHPFGGAGFLPSTICCSREHNLAITMFAVVVLYHTKPYCTKICYRQFRVEDIDVIGTMATQCFMLKLPLGHPLFMAKT